MRESDGQGVSPELMAELARYAGVPLPRERAETLAKILGPALARLRAIRPDGWEHIAPANNFRLPPPPGGENGP